jgi:hypothetical protein
MVELNLERLAAIAVLLGVAGVAWIALKPVPMRLRATARGVLGLAGLAGAATLLGAMRDPFGAAWHVLIFDQPLPGDPLIADPGFPGGVQPALFVLDDFVWAAALGLWALTALGLLQSSVASARTAVFAIWTAAVGALAITATNVVFGPLLLVITAWLARNGVRRLHAPRDAVAMPAAAGVTVAGGVVTGAAAGCGLHAHISSALGEGALAPGDAALGLPLLVIGIAALTLILARRANHATAGREPLAAALTAGVWPVAAVVLLARELQLRPGLPVRIAGVETATDELGAMLLAATAGVLAAAVIALGITQARRRPRDRALALVGGTAAIGVALALSALAAAQTQPVGSRAGLIGVALTAVVTQAAIATAASVVLCRRPRGADRIATIGLTTLLVAAFAGAAWAVAQIGASPQNPAPLAAGIGCLAALTVIAALALSSPRHAFGPRGDFAITRYAGAFHPVGPALAVAAAVALALPPVAEALADSIALVLNRAAYVAVLPAVGG